MVERIIDVMVVTLGILGAFVLYKLMLKRMSRGGVDQTAYCTLYSLDKNPASGEVEFYFITPSEMNVAFCVMLFLLGLFLGIRLKKVFHTLAIIS